jgi:hypothetical protein
VHFTAATIATFLGDILICTARTFPFFTKAFRLPARATVEVILVLILVFKRMHHL